MIVCLLTFILNALLEKSQARRRVLKGLVQLAVRLSPQITNSLQPSG